MNVLQFADNLIRDLQYGFRRLILTPGFTAVAVLSLGLGIGVNTTVFTAVNKALLRPLPVEKPDQIVALSNANSEGRTFPTFSYLNYRDLCERNAGVIDLLAYAPMPVSLSHDGNSARVWGYVVSRNYFDVLGLRPVVGRLISTADDERPGAHPVTVISYDAWRRRFGADPAVVGRNVVVNGRSFTVTGVAPPGFQGVEVAFVAEMWFPMMMQSEIRPRSPWRERRAYENLYVAGRLKSGQTMASVRSALRVAAAQLEREFPAENEGKTIELSPAGLFGSMGRLPLMGFAGVSMAAVGLVLLLVCTNLVNLCLARGAHRQREIAMQQALGASRWRIIRQLLTETVMLSLAGGVIALLMAYWLTGIASQFRLPIDIPFSTQLDLDWRVFAFTLVISLLTGVAFGLLPAWQSTASSTAHGRPARSKLRSILVGAQVCLSFVLMVCAGLTLRSLQQAEFADVGMNPENAFELAFDLDLQGYNRERAALFLSEVLNRVRAIPGIEAAGAGNVIPPDPHIGFANIRVEDRSETSERGRPRAGLMTITPGYLAAMGMTILRGRDFTANDRDGTPRVGLVNETFARRFWNSENPLGKRFSLSEADDSWTEIVGVVKDGKYRSLGENPAPFVFLPALQRFGGLLKIVARANPETGNPLEEIRREVQLMDANLPIFDAQPLTEHMRLPMFPARVAAMMFGTFGSLALVVAALGIFGVVSFTVSRRSQEIGVRMALGARRRDVLGLIFREGMIPVAVGLAAGLAATLVGLPMIEIDIVLYGIGATDPLTFSAIAGLLAAVALLACYFPARRALKVDPIVALRYE
ncbi:MAG: ABC transporter permease [Acidobacteria bacterium]|nr:ABC transporter permease [Acidobacteriota bacterium]